MDLQTASVRLDTSTAFGNASTKYAGVTPMTRSAASMPPNRAANVVQTVINGMASAIAMARGMTSR